MDTTVFLDSFYPIVLRTGVFILLIFGIKVFVIFYKYNLKMLHFYRTRRIILELTKSFSDKSNLKQDLFYRLSERMELYDISKVDFEKTPDSLYKDILEVLKNQNPKT